MSLKAGDTIDSRSRLRQQRRTTRTIRSARRKLVTFGEQTTNEMCFVFLGATSPGLGRSPFGRTLPLGGGLFVPKPDGAKPATARTTAASGE